MEDILGQMVQRRAALEVQVIARRELARREGRSKLAERFGLNPETLRVRPDSFGRFGGSPENGLPGLWRSTALSAQPAPGAGFRVRLDKLDRVDPLEVAWDHKVTRVMGLNDPQILGPPRSDSGGRSPDVLHARVQPLSGRHGGCRARSESDSGTRRAGPRGGRLRIFRPGPRLQGMRSGALHGPRRRASHPPKSATAKPL
jgi:hypothetical protein